ncbi:hypothetical protein [Streptomyces atroolivaceus]|uniref:hypothetical protein n=1 Tax=Streptomyces atroolivaceus TaxID=66869 RepID=UPI00343590C1
MRGRGAGGSVPMGRDGTVAMLACAGQLGALLAGFVVVQFGRTDEYGRPPGALLGLLCVVVFGPPLLLLLGALHTFVVTAPVALAAGVVARRTRGPVWQWQVALLMVLAAVYALAVAQAGAPYVPAWAWIAGSGVLPLLGVGLFRRSERGRDAPVGTGALWFLSLTAGALLTVVSVVSCVVALATGLVGDYSPPQLTRAQLVGVWKGDGGAEIRLDDGGGAVLTAVPYEFMDDEGRCDGRSSWRYVPGDGTAGGTVQFEPVGACVLDTWTVGGTAERPELYELVGDPDAGDVRILVRQDAP